VYRHTAPNGKVYIGITGFDPQYRWLNNGKGYKTQTTFFNAIIKYGWINFKHDILFEDLTEEEALNKEEELIQQYKSYDRRYGYNVSLRGAIYGKDNNGQRQNSRRKEIAPLPEWKNRGKIVLLQDVAGNTIKRFRSVHELAIELNEPVETLRTRLNKYKNLTYPEGIYKYAECQIPKVDMLTMKGEYIKTFNSLVDAYKYVNRVNKGFITQVCVGKKDSYLGYKWRFRYED
jgi:hypothetical protein